MRRASGVNREGIVTATAAHAGTFLFAGMMLSTPTPLLISSQGNQPVAMYIVGWVATCVHVQIIN